MTSAMRFCRFIEREDLLPLPVIDFVHGDEVVLHEAVLGEMTQKYAEQLGFGDVGYYDTTIAGSISGKIIPVDKEIHPQGKNQRIYTLGKGKTVVAISFLMDGDDFTEMNEALDTVHFMF